jgi:putative DNA primase/helicase
VTSAEGAAIVGRNGNADYAGILFPYRWPGENGIREYCLRRDHPELEPDGSGKLKERAKYLWPPGRGNFLYFPPGTDPGWLQEATLPIVLTEGAKKALSLSALAWHGQGDASDRPRFLSIGLPGVWNWRGTTGKAPGPDGSRRKVIGVIPDLERIAYRGRDVTIAFDVNVSTNESVKAARAMLTKELQIRGAKLTWMEWPADVPVGVNGIDDFVGASGPDAALALLATARQPEKQPRVFHDTEYGNAERLVALYGDDLRFCHISGKWFAFDGRRWVEDATADVVRMAKATVRNIYREAADTADQKVREAIVQWARKSERAGQIAAMMKLAESEPGVTVQPHDIDSDKWLLNTLTGTLDLRTGRLRNHARGDLLAKLVPVEYGASAKCPRWTQFLAEVFAQHPDVIPFIQRAVGYSLTADTREECLFLMHGTGRNGKGVFVKTVSAILGDYAGTADFSTFTPRRDEGPRDDVANMRGKRLISAQESREGGALAESLIKWLTGGDKVRARRLYENSYEFEPTHKLWLATNHKPIIRGTDSAIWSRIKLIPFEVSFEGREDRGLKAALLEELPGILAWAVKGCLEWQRHGLEFPESVVKATLEYRDESDHVGRFIQERCVVEEGFSARGSDLYNAYRKWFESGGEEALTQTAFGLRLTERGMKKERGSAGMKYFGIGLGQNERKQKGDTY